MTLTTINLAALGDTINLTTEVKELQDVWDDNS